MVDSWKNVLTVVTNVRKVPLTMVVRMPPSHAAKRPLVTLAPCRNYAGNLKWVVNQQKL